MDEMEDSVVIKTKDPKKAQEEVAALYGDLYGFELICVSPAKKGYKVFFSYTFIHNENS